MPVNKDLKRLVRARMHKTGEAYTAARMQILKKPNPKQVATTAAAAAPSQKLNTSNYAELAGMSDAAIKEKTGCAWDRWVHALDRRGAEKMSHRDIAAIVRDKYKVGPWWSQAVTVGYERIKGLRARGQRRDGSYEATKSRTFNVPIAKLFEAWENARLRRRWLNVSKVKMRTATAPKTMRLDWTDGSILEVGFTAKSREKSSVAVAHTKLPDQETANRLKAEWSERLDALGELLAAK